MRTAVALSLLGLAGLASAAPTKRNITSPLSDGFPSPNASQIAGIEKGAKGSLPNSSLPSTLQNESLSGIYTLQFAERIESFFFTELVSNITKNVSGYSLDQFSGRVDGQYLLKQLRQAANTEQIHALTIGAIANNVNATPLEPCTTYNFPVTDLKGALELAVVLTEASFGVLSDVAQDLANNGDVGLIRAIGQTIAAEGEQGGFYRYVLNKTAEGAPFTTQVNRNMAYTALQGFVDINSCPNLYILENLLETYFALTIANPPGANDTQFTVSVSAEDYGNVSGDVYAVISNQINVPLVQLINGTSNGDSVDFTVNWPYTEQQLNGFTVVTIVNQPGPFADIDEVALATIFGPAFIEI